MHDILWMMFVALKFGVIATLIIGSLILGVCLVIFGPVLVWENWQRLTHKEQDNA